MCFYFYYIHLHVIVKTTRFLFLNFAKRKFNFIDKMYKALFKSQRFRNYYSFLLLKYQFEENRYG